MARLDYANARIAARRERLVGPAWLRELLARSSQEARIDALRTVPLAERLPRDLGTGDAALAAVEAALRAGVRREALAILDGAEGTRARALLGAFLALEEADLVKAVLRGVTRGAALDATIAAAPAVPGVSEEGVRAAASASSVEEALAALEAAGSAIATAVRPALPALAQRGLLPLELAADRAAIERARAARRAARGEDALLLAAHVADRVDARNAATLLALAGAPPVEDAFLDGGRRFGRDELRELAGAAPEAARAALAAAFGVDAAALATPWSADRAIERALIAPLRRDARLRPLSIAVPLAYLLERRAETRRVALVLRGAAIGLSGDELLDLVEA